MSTNCNLNTFLVKWIPLFFFKQTPLFNESTLNEFHYSSLTLLLFPPGHLLPGYMPFFMPKQMPKAAFKAVILLTLQLESQPWSVSSLFHSHSYVLCFCSIAIKRSGQDKLDSTTGKLTSATLWTQLQN